MTNIRVPLERLVLGKVVVLIMGRLRGLQVADLAEQLGPEQVLCGEVQSAAVVEDFDAGEFFRLERANNYITLQTQISTYPVNLAHLELLKGKIDNIR